MAETVKVAISSDFLTAFARLPRQIQGKVTEFVNKFRNNPNAPGINYEKINGGMDGKICSVRIDQTYRGIVARQEESNVYLLLWVDHHDEAYQWAARKRCEVNPKTGAVQVFDIQTITVRRKEEKKPPIFSSATDEQLLTLGVPEIQLPFIRSFTKAEDFYQSKDSMPGDVFEYLSWMLEGLTIKEILELLEEDSRSEDNQPDDAKSGEISLNGTQSGTLSPDHLHTEETIPNNARSEDAPADDRKPAEHDRNDLRSALEKPVSRKSFVVVEGEDELRRMMAEPLDKWRVFLHPTQRKIVKKNYSGPARVLGGAGTGKTVVAMHRAKHLASGLNSRQRILFTTFTANLAADIKNNLRKICTTDEMRKIEVIHLDAWVNQYLRECGFSAQIGYDDEINPIWEQAILLANVDLPYDINFYEEEWNRIVIAQEALSLEKYVRASRNGRGTRLDRRKRMQVWKVFDNYQNLMKEKQVRDINTAMYECTKLLTSAGTRTPYSHVIVDEGQDFSDNAYRLLRALAGEEHRNDLFIVGDSHQRIYRNHPTLSKCGINVRGRSSLLKINYRTTEEIRRYAFALLEGISFDDLDEETDLGDKCQSLTHGPGPVIQSFKDANGELEYLVKEINNLWDCGTALSEICVVARTKKLVDDYITQFTKAGLRAYAIKRNKSDDRCYDGIRVATMHRVKGLEFKYVFIAAVNNRIVPLQAAINHTDAVSESESMTSEKCLLYVALTRAQKGAYITSYGKKSDFLR